MSECSIYWYSTGKGLSKNVIFICAVKIQDVPTTTSIILMMNNTVPASSEPIHLSNTCAFHCTGSIIVLVLSYT